MNFSVYMIFNTLYGMLRNSHLDTPPPSPRPFRQQPYLAISSRLRLTLRFTRVALSLPMAIDRAIEAEEAEREKRRAAHAAAAGVEDGITTANAQVKKRSSILGPKVGGVVNFLVLALEKSESVI